MTTPQTAPKKALHDFAQKIALQAFGYFWAKEYPDQEVPIDKIIEAVNAILASESTSSPSNQ
jgi:hypothetical protein